MEGFKAVVAYAKETHWIFARGVEFDGGVLGRVVEGE